jgi:hypothetical protein
MLRRSLRWSGWPSDGAGEGATDLATLNLHLGDIVRLQLLDKGTVVRRHSGSRERADDSPQERKERIDVRVMYVGTLCGD